MTLVALLLMLIIVSGFETGRTFHLMTLYSVIMPIILALSTLIIFNRLDGEMSYVIIGFFPTAGFVIGFEWSRRQVRKHIQQPKGD